MTGVRDLPVIQGDGVTLRAARRDDLPALLEIIRAPGAAEWWGEYEGSEDDEELLAGFAIEVGGELVGWLGFEEVSALKYPSVGLDIMLAPAVHGNGYGPEALRLAIDYFAERGHHRFTIDPRTDNLNAIAAYRKVGFKSIGIARAQELQPDGSWADALLMDLLVEELDG
jgi:aminoglycoside 6'-N-acetyltransferase